MSMWPPDLTLSADVPAMFDQDGADQNILVGRCRHTALVANVEFLPAWALAGANTNSRTLTLYNRGRTGNGTAVVAQLALTAGVNLEKGVSKSITLGTATDRMLVPGDVLQWESLHIGNGLPDVGGLVVVQLSMR